MALECKILTRLPELESIREEWDACVQALGKPVYLTTDWIVSWWKHYGNGKQLRVFVFREQNELAGLIPMQLEWIGIRPCRLRLAKIVGADLPPRVLNPPVLPESAEAVFEYMVQHLLKVERCDLVRFGPIAQGGVAAEALRRMQGRGTYSTSLTPIDVHTTFHLPQSFEEYIKGLGGKERKIRRKKLRELENEYPLRVEVVQDEAKVLDEFEEFVTQHSRQWEAEGRPGHFRAWPDALAFNRTLVAANAKRNRVRFVKLFAGDTLVANQYTYAFGETLYAELPARAFGAAWERFSLGCTSQLKLIESSIQDGFKRLESGIGHYPYKVLLNGTETPVCVARIAAAGLIPRLKIALYTMAGRSLEIGLLKIWYRRIAPRLSWCRRSGLPAVLLRFKI